MRSVVIEQEDAPEVESLLAQTRIMIDRARIVYRDLAKAHAEQRGLGICAPIQRRQRILQEPLNAKPREIKAFLRGQLAPGRTQELQTEPEGERPIRAG